MSKRLAIRGHSTRGNEVIEILEMMGGKNTEGYIGIDYDEIYTIEDGYIIQSYDWNDCLVLSLEEFLEKFPYKVGDKVHIYVQNDDIDGRYDIEVAEITSMRWNPACCKIAYKMKNINREFYKEEIKCKVDDSNKQTRVMGKKLAIRGHESRGKEVIKILEMMGGHATVINKISNETDKVFFISDNENCFYRKSIRFIPDSSNEIEEFNVFTLEEFLEKYPFKVGELKDLLGSNLSCVISEMRWNAQAECVEYHATFGLNDYGWHKVSDFCSDYQIEELNTVISGINLNSCDYADEVELNLGDYEIEVRDGRTYAVKKKSKYPTTYGECCDILGVTVETLSDFIFKDFHLTVAHTFSNSNEYYINLFKRFFELKLCYDAYCKIASKRLGLDEPWKPDWEDGNLKWCMSYSGNCIEFDQYKSKHHILTFPTEEMRDAFYENFKDLIEQCKELL